MGKITVKVHRVIFKQALVEQIKEMRGTRLCAWPAKSLTQDQVGIPDDETYVIQEVPSNVTREQEF